MTAILAFLNLYAVVGLAVVLMLYVTMAKYLILVARSAREPGARLAMSEMFVAAPLRTSLLTIAATVFRWHFIGLSMLLERTGKESPRA